MSPDNELENQEVEDQEITAEEINSVNDASVQYDLPEDRIEEISVDRDPNEKDFADLSYYEKLAFVSAEKGILVKKPNKNCKSCYGRGYISTTTITMSGDNGDQTEVVPNACKCIFDKRDYHKVFSGRAFANRSLQRKLDKKSGGNSQRALELKAKKQKAKAKRRKKKKNKR